MKTVYIERNKLFKNITMLMCNNIVEADPSFIDYNIELFYTDCEECEGTGKESKQYDDEKSKDCEECGGEGQFNLEPYQYFLTSLDEYEIERLKSFGVAVGTSEKLGLEVIPIYDFGTSWSAFSYSKRVDDDYELSFDETLERTTVY